MATLWVGSGEKYKSLTSAVTASRDGDEILVRAGTYVNDFATINTKISIKAAGGMANFVATVPIPNQKGILIVNKDATITGLSFSGAKVADHNGAGIRYQGGKLTIVNSYFHHNENGILANPVADGSITILNSEFAYNGRGDGRTHNIYVNKIATFRIEGSYIHDAAVGHEIKSRAVNNVIANNRIYDNASGSASYSIDLPNGGSGVISNNIIEQGPASQNPAIIHVGGEAPIYGGSSVLIRDNVIINHKNSASAVAVLNQAVGAPVKFVNNDVFGLTAGQMVRNASQSGTTILTTDPSRYTTAPWQAGTVPPDRLVLYLAEDSGAGHIRFIVSVDGKPLGTPQAVTAVEQNTQTQAFNFLATLGPGTHTVAIKYESDTLGGPATTRRLHVEGLDYDGRHYAAATDLLRGGMATFAVAPFGQ